MWNLRSAATSRRAVSRATFIRGVGSLSCLALGGCWSPAERAVVVYTAQDSEFAKPLFADFAQETGIEVLPKFDTESTKTVGLAEAIVAEGGRPRCDVFWNNEILHAVRLEKLGLLEVYRPVAATQYPAKYQSKTGAWHGFAARARVLLINTNRVGSGEPPRSILNLNDEKWHGKVGIAKPLFGTTATHAACLFAIWGDHQAKQFFRQLRGHAKILSGNKQVAASVAAGELAVGLTDTDDAIAELDRGMPVRIEYPDQQPGGLGTLFIPNTLAIVKGCPHPDEARRLVDYLLTSKVEARLAAGPSAQIPLLSNSPNAGRIPGPATVRAMQVDFEKAGECWDRAARFLRDEFTAAN